jgi:hypothetical protein
MLDVSTHWTESAGPPQEKKERHMEAQAPGIEDLPAKASELTNAEDVRQLMLRLRAASGWFGNSGFMLAFTTYGFTMAVGAAQ